MVDSHPADGGAPLGGVPMHAICGHLLRRAQQVHTAIWTESFGTDLTSPQYAVLTALAAHPRIDQHRLGQLVSLDKSSVADVVARLTDRAWIVREGDPQDARRNVLTLAPGVGATLDRLTSIAQSVQDRLLEIVPMAQRPHLVSGLRQIASLDPRNWAAFVVSPISTLRSDAPGALLRRAQQMHTALWTETFGQTITGPQFAAVQTLAQHPGISQRSLGERAALDKSTAADIIARLARRGWVERENDPFDRRLRLLTLTTTGRETAESTFKPVMQIQERLLEPVPASERERFLEALAVLAYSRNT